MHNGGGAYRHCGMYSPPLPLGDEFGRGEGYGYSGGRYGSGYHRYYDLPLRRRPGGTAYGGFGVLRRHGPLGRAGRGLGMGMSNGGVAPGGALGVGGFDFDDASTVPAAPDTLWPPQHSPWQRYDRKWCR